MDEYISREATVQKIKQIGAENYSGMYANIGMTHAAQIVKFMPAADVAPVVHSHWEVAIGYDPKKKVQCQHCKLMNYEPEDYCPHCGARMDEKNGKQNE